MHSSTSIKFGWLWKWNGAIKGTVPPPPPHPEYKPDVQWNVYSQRFKRNTHGDYSTTKEIQLYPSNFIRIQEARKIQIKANKEKEKHLHKSTNTAIISLILHDQIANKTITNEKLRSSERGNSKCKINHWLNFKVFNDKSPPYECLPSKISRQIKPAFLSQIMRTLTPIKSYHFLLFRVLINSTFLWDSFLVIWVFLEMNIHL